MLEIIRSGDADKNFCTAPRRSLRKKHSDDKPYICRAPGITTDRFADILKPIARAAIMPAEFKQPNSVDFEPSKGPSLFTNFKRSMTTDERIQQWQRDRDNVLASQNHTTISKQSSSVCGTDVRGVRHVYMTSGSHRTAPPGSAYAEHYLPVCKNCTILCETLDRLRKNLTLSKQSVPKPETIPDILTAARGKEQLDPRSNDPNTERRMKPAREESTIVGRRQQAVKTRPHLHPYDKSLFWEEDYIKGTSYQGSERRTNGLKQSSASTRNVQAPQDDAAPSFIEQFEQLRCKMVDDRARPPQSPPVSPEPPVRDPTSSIPQSDPRTQEQFHESKNHNATHLPSNSVKIQDQEAERQAQAIEVLADLKKQRQKDESEGICRVDAQVEYPQPSLWEQGIAQARAAIPQGNNVDWLQRQVQNLEAQLRARAPPF
jgi:hypothetical protein